MFDETQIKIIDATMTIIVEKGYSGTTTKNIAKLAGVNECTIFRKFDGKKEIILAAMSLPKWNPGLSEKDFAYVGIPEEDLVSFSRTYMTKVTPQMVGGFQKGIEAVFYGNDRKGKAEKLRCGKCCAPVYFNELWICFPERIFWG